MTSVPFEALHAAACVQHRLARARVNLGTGSVVHAGAWAALVDVLPTSVASVPGQAGAQECPRSQHYARRCGRRLQALSRVARGGRALIEIRPAVVAGKPVLAVAAVAANQVSALGAVLAGV